MLRFRRSRWVSFVLLLGAAIAPASSVAHGVAHHREAEHEAEHLAARAIAAVTEQPVASAPAAPGLEERHDDHPDVRVDAGLTAKAEFLAIPTLADALPPVVVLSISPRVQLVAAAQPRADPDDGPPATLRAPPRA